MKLPDLVEAGLLVVVTVGGIAVAVLWLGGGVVGTRIGRTRFGKPSPPASTPSDDAEPPTVDEDFPAAYWNALPDRKDKR